METAIAVGPKPAGVETTLAATPRFRPSSAGFKPKLEAKRPFDAQAFLNSSGVSRKVVEYRNKETVFAQGDAATSVLYIQKGSVKLTVVSEAGKGAVVAILGPDDFFGEGCLAGQPQRGNTATTITPTRIVVLKKPEMIRVLHAERTLFDQFIKHLLSRHIRVEEDLIDQLFNRSEKRLARALLLLARYGSQGQSQKVIPKVSQEVLAEMVGTTRSRVNFFMNKFRKSGFIEYGGSPPWLQINTSLLNVVLQDYRFGQDKNRTCRTSRFELEENHRHSAVCEDIAGDGGPAREKDRSSPHTT
jgi:CRP/FNR family transcriptional regulator, cyclic AMP receptor protein